jgi:cobalt-precorrin 5A hydrolase
MDGDEAMTVIAGIGCRRHCSTAPIVALVRYAAARTGGVLACLAVPDFKGNEHGLREAAHVLGLPLVLVTREALEAAQPRCQTFSARSKRAIGVASIAEGCALAEAGPAGRLLLPRITANGATCALAEAPEP